MLRNTITIITRFIINSTDQITIHRDHKHHKTTYSGSHGKPGLVNRDRLWYSRMWRTEPRNLSRLIRHDSLESTINESQLKFVLKSMLPQFKGFIAKWHFQHLLKHFSNMTDTIAESFLLKTLSIPFISLSLLLVYKYFFSLVYCTNLINKQQQCSTQNKYK